MVLELKRAKGCLLNSFFGWQPGISHHPPTKADKTSRILVMKQVENHRSVNK